MRRELKQQQQLEWLQWWDLVQCLFLFTQIIHSSFSLGTMVKHSLEDDSMNLNNFHFLFYMNKLTLSTFWLFISINNDWIKKIESKPPLQSNAYQLYFIRLNGITVALFYAFECQEGVFQPERICYYCYNCYCSFNYWNPLPFLKNVF